MKKINLISKFLLCTVILTSFNSYALDCSNIKRDVRLQKLAFDKAKTESELFSEIADEATKDAVAYSSLAAVSFAALSTSIFLPGAPVSGPWINAANFSVSAQNSIPILSATIINSAFFKGQLSRTVIEVVLYLTTYNATFYSIGQGAFTLIDSDGNKIEDASGNVYIIDEKMIQNSESILLKINQSLQAKKPEIPEMTFVERVLDGISFGNREARTYRNYAEWAAQNSIMQEALLKIAMTKVENCKIYRY